MKLSPPLNGGCNATTNALLDQIRKVVVDFGGKRAVVNETGRSVSYAELWESAAQVSKHVLGPAAKGRSVAINTTDPIWFTCGLLATWMNGSIAVPLRT